MARSAMPALTGPPQPRPHPPYWRTDGADADRSRWETRYMRRKLEYLLRSCAAHPDGCCDQEGMGHARVLRVERVENAELWGRYATKLHSLEQKRQPGGSALRPEHCRPVRCAELGADECYLFHGTSIDQAASIWTEGFDLARARESGRYGRGVYFTDQSCKAHQYAAAAEDEDTFEENDKVHCILYCRVAMGGALPYAPGLVEAEERYLAGMEKPRPGDPVFDARIRGEHRGHHWDSVDVREESEAQVHRELVVYDADQIYPEFVVFYRTDSAEEEAEALVRRGTELLEEADKVEECLPMLIEFTSCFKRRRVMGTVASTALLCGTAYTAVLWLKHQENRDKAADRVSRAARLAPDRTAALVEELRPAGMPP